MKSIFKFTSIFTVFIFLISSCQHALIKKEVKSAEVDSSLYFKQVEISDPFLEKLAANQNQTFTLNKKIIPPPPPEPEIPKYKTIEGFRVQIYAGIDAENALANLSIAKSTVKDTIYQFEEKGLIKLQVGNYPFYPQADSIKRIFRQTHFPGAWIVKTNIFIPNTEAKADSFVISQENFTTSGKFKIQILATGDETKSQAIVKELKSRFNGRAFYESSENIFKVYVGYFENEDEARSVLKAIREGQYPDAWLVY